MKKLLLLLMPLLMFSCASQSGSSSDSNNSLSKDEAAKLFTDPESVYPDEDYLFAVGTGDTRRDAENDAMGALARIFRSDISMSSEGVKQYRELISGDDSQLSEVEKNLVQTTTVTAQQDLLGIKYSPSYTDDRGVVHILAILDRKAVGKLYRGLIQKNEERVNSLLELADSTDSVARKYAYTQGAYTVAQGNQIYLDQLKVINPAYERLSQPEVGLNELEQMVQKVQSNMSFQVRVEGDYADSLTEVIKQELGKSNLAVSDDGPMVVTGSVRFSPLPKSGQYEVVQWQVSFNLVDNQGTVLASFEKIDRENSISQDQAKLLAIKSIEKIVKREFIPDVMDYFQSLIVQ
ncbi:LPP20 family lipoprotein [Spirochaeta cellobiosiphila]|uniref:LPP20 family lipoprotein n=1 Tax=Spirochaeta cellobiosiphila TaxID=504483 RepID=UPI00041E3238|nr:LPP20 family lipoprotein [Spirochaeta cellobiosiphila]